MTTVFLKRLCSVTLTLGLCMLGTARNPSKVNEPLSADPDSFPLLELSIHDLQQKMESGELSSRQITELYLDRILAIDKDGPQLNSVIEINPDALEIAEAMDRERAEGNVRGPMHGIPVMIKDNIDAAGHICMQKSIRWSSEKPQRNSVDYPR